ncbi:unnamed protein product [Caenorhabditis angaria]|uniref:Uncharacterized protein n=1 Tax=Caenorhabditis angaria TaxID=860376 RepID=A0A9P1N4R2_9PELO|nr:unnamed protein product [Caenorhabditis angaria]
MIQLASPDILIIAYDVITFLSIPIYFLGFYCVIKKSPKGNKTLKICMLMSCFWCVVMDFIITVLVKPTLLFPEFCIYTLGWLTDYFDFSQEFQTYLVIFVIAAVGTSCVCIMENRYHHIKDIRIRSSTVQITIYTMDLSVAFIFEVILHFYIPDQQSSKKLMFEKMSLFPEAYYKLPMFVISVDKVFTLIKLAIFIFFIVGQFIIYFSVTYYELFMITNIAMSASTRKFQRLLFIDVTIQSVVPTVCIGAPFILLFGIGITGYYDQGLNNFMFLLVSLHGIISVSTMILIHRPFRRFLFRQKTGMSMDHKSVVSAIKNQSMIPKRRLTQSVSVRMNNQTFILTIMKVENPYFLLITYDIISLSSVPIYILGFYCVLKKCPKNSKNLKWCMLMSCVWCSIMDLVTNTLVKPMVLFPEFCLYTLGPLTKYFDFSQKIQVFMFVFGLAGVSTSCVCIIGNRYHHIKNIKMRPITFQLFLYSCNFSIQLLFMVSLYIFIPDQETALKIVFQNLPSIPSNFLQLKLPFVVSISKPFTLTKFSVIGSFQIVEFFIFFGVTYYQLFMITNNLMSNATRKFQKSLFIDVTIQSSVPILSMAIPLSYFIGAGIYDYYNQVGSPDFFTKSYDFISISSIPIYILGFYCVLTKCPKSSKSFKWCLLISCVWCVIMDLIMNTLVQPLTLSPAFCFYTLGPLTEYLYVSQEFQIFMFVFSVAGVSTSCVSIIGNRYQHIKQIKLSSFIFQSILTCLNLFATFLFILALYLFIPEQESALEHVFKSLPDLPPIFHQMRTPFVISINPLLTILKLSLIGTFITGEFVFLFGVTFYELFMITNHSMSHATKKLQKELYIDVAIQSMVPILLMAIPASYFVFAGIFTYYNQALNNIVFILFSLHGIVSVITMLLIHKPFRRFLFCTKVNTETKSEVIVQS